MFILLQVFQILDTMPNIHFLNLSENPLQHSTSEPPGGDLKLDKITKLALNSTKVTWRQVGKLLKIMPKWVVAMT